jgi:hypothetical protein
VSHTPGPWNLGDSDLPTSNISIHGGTRKHTTIAKLVSADFVGMPIDEAMANARLMAAAPDLLEALLPIAKAYPDDPGTSDLDNEQPVTITLGDVRRVWRALKWQACRP